MFDDGIGEFRSVTTPPVQVDTPVPTCVCGTAGCDRQFDHERAERGAESHWWRQASMPARWGWPTGSAA